MSPEQFKSKVIELFDNCKTFTLEKSINKILNSGSIDLESYEDNYLLPKAFITAYFEEQAHQYRPYNKEARNEVDNIKLFL